MQTRKRQTFSHGTLPDIAPTGIYADIEGNVATSCKIIPYAVAASKLRISLTGRKREKGVVGMSGEFIR